MLGKTHIVVGIGTALIATQPTTLPELVTASIGGAVGGAIVDIDCKDMEVNREKIYDSIIAILFIGVFVVLDFLMGEGMCRYILDNHGNKLWGALVTTLILVFVGYNSKHRTFTHSFIGMALFSGAIYLFCKPAVIPFAVGYASHLLIDLFNKRGMQLFFPLEQRLCLNVCHADKKANRILFWVALAIDVVWGAALTVLVMPKDGGSMRLLDLCKSEAILGLNYLELYLIFINAVTFFGFERNYKMFFRDIFDAYENGKEYREEDYDSLESRFEIWLLNFGVFIGGGIGMLFSLVIHLSYPSSYNGMWWSFCYSSSLFWTTTYLYICNPSWLVFKNAGWFLTDLWHLLAYVFGINIVSALFFYLFRNKRLNEYSFKHTVLWLAGALGGTVGGIITVLTTRHEQKFYYASRGFFIMLFSQIIFMLHVMIN